MDQELKTKWIKALTDGSYQQAESQLQTPDGHCCLGVLADISGKGTWDGYSWFTNLNNQTYMFETDFSDPGHGDKITELFGISEELGKNLISLNDGEWNNDIELYNWVQHYGYPDDLNQPFDVIARFIEDHL